MEKRSPSFGRESKGSNFSDTELVDCTNNGGCNGGQLEPGFELIKNHGLVEEQAYPYASTEQTCKNVSAPVVKIQNYMDVSGREAMLKALKTSPVLLGLHANLRQLHFYVSGVIDVDPKDCSPYLQDHVVVLIGYGEDYLILRNSWSLEFGDQGHFMMKMGLCGLGTVAYSVTL